MNVAKWLLFALLALPLAELAAFIAVAATIGFLPAVGLLLIGSFAGALVLRRAGGNHIARMRVVLGDGRVTALEADQAGTLILIAGFLLLGPGFITDILALLVLIGPLRRGLVAILRRASSRPHDGVVDLEREQWHRVPDPALPRQERDRQH